MNICINSGRRSAKSSKSAVDVHGHYAAEEPARVLDFMLPAQRATTQTSTSAAWQNEFLADSHLPRSSARGIERFQNSTGTSTSAGRSDFDPRRVGDACRAALLGDSRTSEGSGYDARAGGRSGRLHPDAKPDARPAEPWWRTQISQQMDHARLESTERQRRQRIATVLAENEQHRRMAEQRAFEMEDDQERVRRREFAKIVLDEEQHSRVREDYYADQTDIADRNKRRFWAVRALREEQGRATMERLELREVEQGRADPHSRHSRALVDQTIAQHRTMQRNRALFLAGLKIHVECLRAAEEVAAEAEAQPWHAYPAGDPRRTAAAPLNRLLQDRENKTRSRIDQAILDLYTRDCLATDMWPTKRRSETEQHSQSTPRAVSLNAVPGMKSLVRPHSIEERIVQVRRSAFQGDFETAVKPMQGGLRALSAYAIRPQAWTEGGRSDSLSLEHPHSGEESEELRNGTGVESAGGQGPGKFVTGLLQRSLLLPAAALAL
jgi:hypothetical protein